LGVGPLQGLGASLACYFAAKGLHVFIVGRTVNRLQDVAEHIRGQGGSATPVLADARVEQDMARLFKQVKEHDQAPAIAVYNVDSNIPLPFLETDAATFTNLWQQNCLGAFLFAQQALPLVLDNRQGTLIFTGASASLRAKPPFTAFAAAKAGLRALAQGLAREFGPQGIHVVHAIIDGVIDGDRARQQFPDYVSAKGSEGLLQLEAIAETYWALAQQQPSAWTHELDLRPFKEPF
jgi:NAD(P)-dependent dehydrogenase (short-subunit alcohol dehydrogenase family)